MESFNNVEPGVIIFVVVLSGFAALLYLLHRSNDVQLGKAIQGRRLDFRERSVRLLVRPVDTYPLSGPGGYVQVLVVDGELWLCGSAVTMIDYRLRPDRILEVWGGLENGHDLCLVVLNDSGQKQVMEFSMARANDLVRALGKEPKSRNAPGAPAPWP